MADVPMWYKDFISAVITALPDDMDEQTAIQWLKDPQALEAALRPLVNATAAGAGASGGAANQVSRGFKNDKTGEGWVLEEDVREPATISAGAVELTDLGDGGDYLFGDEVIDRVHTIDRLLGQVHCEYFVEHADEFPEDFQKYMLVFAGTIWRSPEGNHQVPCATYRQGEWSLLFGILEGGLENRDLLVQAKQE